MVGEEVFLVDYQGEGARGEVVYISQGRGLISQFSQQIGGWIQSGLLLIGEHTTKSVLVVPGWFEYELLHEVRFHEVE